MVGEGEVRDGFKFRGGSLPLDLAATVAGRLRAEPKDLLQEPADLARWLVAAGLATKKLKVTTEDLEEARALREALYRLALARADGQRLPEKDRASLNRFAEGATPAPRLDHDGVTWPHASVPPLLAMIARTGVELLGGALRDRIRHCSGEGCALLFVDTSRSGHRKWCSMAGCGNKAKVASFRERSR